MSATPVPKCVACYEPAKDDLEHAFICPAGVVCGRCIRIATGDPYWICVGGLHAVVVQAGTHQAAVKAAKASPRYDKNSSLVILVSDLEKDCRKAK
jgi:hypothetical protein